MPLKATFGSRQNPQFIDGLCFDVIWALASLPPASVTKRDDLIEFKILRRFVQRPDMEDSIYFFTCDPFGNAYPKIVQHHGAPKIFTVPPVNDSGRFDRVTIQEFSVHHRHFLLRPMEELLYPFDDATVYSKRENVDLLYNGHKYTLEFRTAWKFPSRDESWNLYCTRPMFECFVTTPHNSVQDLMEVVTQCTPRVFGNYVQEL